MTNHETAKHLRDAQRRLRSVLVANADRLSTPFTDDPDKNPWDTYLRPAVRGLQEAVSAACDALAAPAAVSVPPPAPRADDQAALRDRIAEALIAWTYRGKDPEHGGILETVRANAYSRADAVLAVLPEPADRAAVLREAAEWFDSGIRSVSQMFGHQAATALRRMADEAQPARLDRCPHGCDTSTCPCLACEADEVEQPDGPCVAGEQQNETPEAVEHMLARMRADAATDSLDGLLRIIADWYRSSEGRDVLFEDLIAAGYRLPERASE